MPKVKLHGANGERTVEVSPRMEAYSSEPSYTTVYPQQTENGRVRNTDPAADIHRKASFACMQKLPLETVSDDDMWDYIKDHYGVTSRSHFTTQEWVVISARLNNAYRDPIALETLEENVWRHREKKRKF